MLKGTEFYKRVGYDVYDDGDGIDYGICYFNAWVFFGSDYDLKAFIESQYRLFPTLDAAIDIFEYLPSWDRADADIFTIAHDIMTDLDYHIEYFENEYSEYKGAGLTGYCNELANILEKLKVYKANRTF